MDTGKAFTKRPRGREPTLTPEITKKICDALELGSYLESAAAYAGVHKTTLHKWLYRGRKAKKGMWHDFVALVDMAIEKSEVRKVQRIDQAAAKGDWRADAWMLERKMPKRWGRKETVRLEDDETKDSHLSEDSVNATIARALDGAADDRWDDNPAEPDKEPGEDAEQA